MFSLDGLAPITAWNLSFAGISTATGDDDDVGGGWDCSNAVSTGPYTSALVGCLHQTIHLCGAARGNWTQHFAYYKCLERVVAADPYNLTRCDYDAATGAVKTCVRANVSEYALADGPLACAAAVELSADELTECVAPGAFAGSAGEARLFAAYEFTRETFGPTAGGAPPFASPTIFVGGAFARVGCGEHTDDAACEQSLLDEICGNYTADARPAACDAPVPVPPTTGPDACVVAAAEE